MDRVYLICAGIILFVTSHCINNAGSEVRRSAGEGHFAAAACGDEEAQLAVPMRDTHLAGPECSPLIADARVALSLITCRRSVLS
jgi:hypothetical protein